MDEIKTLLEEKLKTMLEKIGTLASGSEERRKAIGEYETLHKQWIELLKVESARKEHVDRHELERDKHFLDSQTQDDDRRLKEAQHKTQKVFQWVTIGVTVVCGTLIPVVANRNTHIRGLRYEETGSVNASHNRNCFPKLFHTLGK